MRKLALAAMVWAGCSGSPPPSTPRGEHVEAAPVEAVEAAASPSPRGEHVAPPEEPGEAPVEGPVAAVVAPDPASPPIVAEPDSSAEPPAVPAVDSEVGLAPRRLGWSGLRALFFVHPGWPARSDEEGRPPHATLIGCTDGHGWSRDLDCGDRIRRGGRIDFADGSVGRVRRRLPDEAYGHVVFALDRVPEHSRFAAYASSGAPSALRAVACGMEGVDEAPPPSPISPIAPESLASFDARPASCAPFRDGLASGELRPEASIRGDFDGDGASERLVTLASSAMPDAQVLVLDRGGTSWLVEIRDDRYFSDRGERCASESKRVNVDDTHCFDLDADGAVEVLTSNAGDTERYFELVEIGPRGELTRLADIGFGD